MGRSSPEVQLAQFVVDAYSFLHLQRMVPGSRRTLTGVSSTIKPFQFPLTHNPRNVVSKGRVWMNSVALCHVPARVRPPARHRQEGIVSPSYPVWGIRLAPPRCRSRSNTPWCGRALRFSRGTSCAKVGVPISVRVLKSTPTISGWVHKSAQLCLKKHPQRHIIL
jgi:hypothetical protein